MKKVLALILSLCLAVGGILLLVEANKPANAAGGTVSVQVKPVHKLVLTLSTLSVDFGVDMWPGDTATAASPIGVTVVSSKAWNLTYDASGFLPAPAAFPLASLKYGAASNGTGAVPFSSTGTLVTGAPKTSKAGETNSYYYTLTIPDTAVSETVYTASVVYTAIQ
ncbi:MAG TPA: hypothetical protein VGL40_04070 [Bacillota bacterium]|jgi:hypothetical protein